MNLRFWKAKPSPQKIEVVRRDSLKIRLSEWRGDPDLVSHASGILNSNAFKWMLDVLRVENPANFQLPINASPDVRAAHQCRIEGYSLALSNLEALGAYIQKSEPLTPTFEPETHED